MRLPIDYSNFAELVIRKFDFVDKTLLIQALIDSEANSGEKVTLITRPRRFGKTLNLSMLKCFFDVPKTSESTESLFRNLKIHQAGAEYLAHQGKYPVISLSFKDVKEDNFLSAKRKIQELIMRLYDEFSYLQQAEQLTPYQKRSYNSIINNTADEIQFENALKLLTECLFSYHHQKAVILIDEYDTPIQSAYLNGYYEKIMPFFRNFFGAGLKDNTCLFRAVLTGILRVSRESLFSGLNNISCYSVLNHEYSEHFGFTENEVSHLLQQANLTEQASDIKNWYNGYQIGETILYNPWSIVNCIQKQGVLKPYWINTSDNALIKKLLLNSTDAFKESFERLLRGHTIEKAINENFVYADFDKKNSIAAYSLLLMAGYLKVVSLTQTDRGTLCELAIPNREIRSLYSTIIEEWINQIASGEEDFEWYNQFIKNLLGGNIPVFEKDLGKILEQTVSFHDVAKEPEAFYHALIIGLTATLGASKDYEIRSNRESGDGRYDYCILSRDPEKLSILFEFKKADKDKIESKKLKSLAKAALKQIAKNNYVAEIKQRGGKKILKIGMAFSGKQLALAHEKIEIN